MKELGNILIIASIAIGAYGASQLIFEEYLVDNMKGIGFMFASILLALSAIYCRVSSSGRV